MVTITLPPDLEQIITEEARQQGTSAELLVLDKLRQIYLPAAISDSPTEGQTMADFFAGYIGCIHSSEVVPGGAQMSTDSGKKFAAGMVKKRQEGKL